MEIHFAPETEKKLQDLAAQSGRKTADELVQDVIEGYFEELAQTLTSRYGDLKSAQSETHPRRRSRSLFPRQKRRSSPFGTDQRPSRFLSRSESDSASSARNAAAWLRERNSTGDAHL